MPKLRVGIVNFLNSKPLAWGFLKEQAADHHTPDFFIDDSGLDVGVRALIGMTLHYMKTNPKPRP